MACGSAVTTIVALGRDVRKRLGDRAQVAHAVVDDGDFRHQDVRNQESEDSQNELARQYTVMAESGAEQ